MIGHHFLVIAALTRPLKAQWRDRAIALGATRSLALCHDDARLLVWESGTTPNALSRAGGVIVGDLYRGGSVIGAGSVTEADAVSIAMSRGRHLIDRYWGSYIAFLSAPEHDRLDIVRAPLGDLPCLYVVFPDVIVLASDVGLLVQLGVVEAKVDRSRLARFLLAEDVHRAETCIEGIDELPGGYRLSIGQKGMEIEPLWTPWHYIEPAIAISDVAEAADAVRTSVLNSVDAIAASHNRILLRLSGGLDSSIVAAALKERGRDATALNLVTLDPSGDERGYARAVAQQVGYDLAERTREPAHVDLTLSEAAALSRPMARAFAQASGWHSRDLANEVGASAIFDGGGGDSIFCFLVTARLAADCLMTGKGKGHFWSTAKNVASLAQVSNALVARRAWSIRLRRSPEFPYPVDARFLSADAIAESAAAASHPWLDAPPNALPGRVAHVTAIATVQGVREARDSTQSLPIYSPLLTQPVVETCLRIPSWLWVRNGCDRAVARQAFSELLPPLIVQRRSKGSPDSFLIELYETNRHLIRIMLLDGALAATGLLDVRAIAHTLDDHRPVTGVDFYRILRLVDIEAWLRSL